MQRQKNASEQRACKNCPRRAPGEFGSEPDLVVVTIPILSPMHPRTASFDCTKVFQVARAQRDVPLPTIFRRFRERSEGGPEFCGRSGQKKSFFHRPVMEM